MPSNNLADFHSFYGIGDNTKLVLFIGFSYHFADIWQWLLIGEKSEHWCDTKVDTSNLALKLKPGDIVKVMTCEIVILLKWEYY